MAGDRVGERRLARAVRAHDRVHLVRVDREVDALDDLGAVLERDVQVLQFEQCQVRISSHSRAGPCSIVETRRGSRHRASSASRGRAAATRRSGARPRLALPMASGRPATMAPCQISVPWRSSFCSCSRSCSSAPSGCRRSAARSGPACASSRTRSAETRRSRPARSFRLRLRRRRLQSRRRRRNTPQSAPEAERETEPVS